MHTGDHNCGSCEVAPDRGSRLLRLGRALPADAPTVALAGNPNTGKSTVFNALTGLRQRVGNWSGTTVVRTEGAYSWEGTTYRVVDLPGTYSLLTDGRDEEVARDFLLFGNPRVTVVVLDASRLERNLNLALQITQLNDRVVVAVNLMDEAARHGITVDDRHLARELDVTVVPMTASRGEGVPELLAAIAAAAGTGRPAGRRAESRLPLPAGVHAAVRELVADLELAYPRLPHARWVALRLLEGDQSIRRAVADGTIGTVLAS